MHVMTTFPLVTAIVAARLVRFERSQEEAAIDLGASQWQMMTRVVLPQLAPALAAAFIFAFAWSFNNFEISFFTGGYDQTFPVWVYSVLRHSNNLPIVNAMSTLISVVQVAVVYLLWWGRSVGSSRRRGSADDWPPWSPGGSVRDTRFQGPMQSERDPRGCEGVGAVGAAPRRGWLPAAYLTVPVLVLLALFVLPDGDPRADQCRHGDQRRGLDLVDRLPTRRCSPIRSTWRSPRPRSSSPRPRC